MANIRIEKYRADLAKASGNKKAVLQIIERIKMSVASSYLGREFLETCEEFEARNPDVSEFVEWTKTITLTPEYTFFA